MASIVERRGVSQEAEDLHQNASIIEEYPLREKLQSSITNLWEKRPTSSSFDFILYAATAIGFAIYYQYN